MTPAIPYRLERLYRQINLALGILALGGALAFAGFLFGTLHERSRWEAALGPCDLPATPLDMLLVKRSPSGTFYCQPRRTS